MRPLRTVVDRWRIASRLSSRWSELDLWQRRAIKAVTGIVVLVAASSVLYHATMVAFEGRSPRFGHSVQVVVETYTGTGYGSDSPWESPVTNAFVSLMDLSTFLLLFIVVPYVFRPVLEDALTPAAPTSVEKAGHVVVCGRTQQGRRLVDELEARAVDYVVVVDGEEAALELRSDDVEAIHGDPTSPEALEAACAGAARSAVVDTPDGQSASVVLALREVAGDLRTVVLVEDLDRERHLRYAGADQVLTPRHLLGRRVAERITTAISPARSDSVTIGPELSILELSVFEESPINGRTIGEVEDSLEASDRVVGLWRDGTFVGSPDPDTTIDEDTVLLLAGREAHLRELEAETYRGRGDEPSVIVAGYGVVGSTVVAEFEGSAAACTVIDVEDREGVDVVGDATEEETLVEAGIDDATVFVVAIAADDEAMLAVLLAHELADDLDVLVRVNRAENDAKVRRAGADYVLSLPEISGRVLAREVLHQEVLSHDRQLEVVRIDGSPFAGRPLGETGIAGADCAVVAVERDGELLTGVEGDFEVREGDLLLVAGSDEAIDAVAG